MTYLVKLHKTYRLVAGVCDKELVGKTFEEGKRILEITERFYGGEEVKEEKELMETLVDLAKEDATMMIVGKKSIDCALRAGIINKTGVKTVQGMPFALILL